MFSHILSCNKVMCDTCLCTLQACFFLETSIECRQHEKATCAHQAIAQLKE